MIYRKSTTTSLGYPCDQTNKAHKRIHITIRGLPPEWHQQELDQFLQEHKWTDRTPITKQLRNRRQWEWHLQAIPPADSNPNQEIWTYEDEAEKISINIITTPAKQRKPQKQQFIATPQNWWKGVRKEEMHVPEQQQAGQTTGNTTASRSQFKEAEPSGREASRSPRRKTEVAPTELDESSSQSTPETKTHTISTAALPLDPDSAVLQGWIEKDVGGTGDCGYRAIAAARHHIKTGNFLTNEQAKTEDAELRVLSCLHTQKHLKRFKEWWGPDSRETAEHRNGKSAPQNIEEWVSQQADPKVWISGLALQSVAERTGLVIIVWKANGKEWSRATFASKFSHNTACIAKKERPITLILKNSHYTFLAPPDQTGTPHTWMTDSANKLIIDLTGNGRQTPASSSRTPSVHTYRSQRSTSTPSVHTCAHSAKQQPTSRKRAFTPGVPRAHVSVTAGDPSLLGKKFRSGRSSCSSKCSIPKTPNSNNKESTDMEVWTCPHCDQRFEASSITFSDTKETIISDGDTPIETPTSGIRSLMSLSFRLHQATSQ